MFKTRKDEPTNYSTRKKPTAVQLSLLQNKQSFGYQSLNKSLSRKKGNNLAVNCIVH